MTADQHRDRIEIDEEKREKENTHPKNTSRFGGRTERDNKRETFLRHELSILLQ